MTGQARLLARLGKLLPASASVSLRRVGAVVAQENSTASRKVALPSFPMA